MQNSPGPILRPRPTYSNVTATVALFIALGGTSYAVATLPRNSVGERQLKNSAVTGDKVRAGTVRRGDLAADALTPGPRGPRGEQGPNGTSGPPGPPGPVGPSEVLNVRRDSAITIPAQGGGSVYLAAVTIKPGAWILEGQAKVVYQPSSPVSEWFDCDLVTASGTLLSRGTSRVGTDSIAVITATIPVRAAVTVDVATQIMLQCRHPSAVPGGMYAEQTDLQAVRVGSVEQL